MDRTRINAQFERIRNRPPTDYNELEARRLQLLERINQQDINNGVIPFIPVAFDQSSRSTQKGFADFYQLLMIMQLLVGIVSRVAGIVLVDPTDEQAMNRRERVRNIDSIDTIIPDNLLERELETQRFQSEIENERERQRIEWSVLRIDPSLSGEALIEAVRRRREEIRLNLEQFERERQRELQEADRAVREERERIEREEREIYQRRLEEVQRREDEEERRNAEIRVLAQDPTLSGEALAEAVVANIQRMRDLYLNWN